MAGHLSEAAEKSHRREDCTMCRRTRRRLPPGRAAAFRADPGAGLAAENGAHLSCHALSSAPPGRHFSALAAGRGLRSAYLEPVRC
jgi:hypothetical protein